MSSFYEVDENSDEHCHVDEIENPSKVEREKKITEKKLSISHSDVHKIQRMP